MLPTSHGLGMTKQPAVCRALKARRFSEVVGTGAPRIPPLSRQKSPARTGLISAALCARVPTKSTSTGRPGPNVSHHRGLRPDRRRERLRRPRPRDRTCRPGTRHHQSRHRPAGLPHAGPYRRGRDQGAPRRPARLYAGDRHQAPTRGGRRRHPPAPQRRGFARPGDHRAGRQDHHVRGDPDVRRARRRHPLPRPRVSDLPLDDRIHRRAADADPDPREERFRVFGRRRRCR